MKLAIVGAGVSGLTCAHLLHSDHDLTVFEAAAHVGGHAHTVDVDDAGGRVAVDTGFIVFNERTYPNFVKLLRAVGVSWQESDMSFSVRNAKSGLEWNGTSLDTLFVQRRNALRPSFLGMLRDVLRFNAAAATFAAGDDRETTLGEFVARGRFGAAFVRDYLVPMGSAIWSMDPARMPAFPFLTFARFFRNHGMLSIDDRPRWLTIPGGSRRYVDALIRPFADRIRVASPVAAVRRHADWVEVEPAGRAAERFDGVILACHADQSLRMLKDADGAESSWLEAFPYQENESLLHTDESLLPRARKAWASWNYHVGAEPAARAPAAGGATVTYWMNRLQRLASRTNYCVTLNRAAAVQPDRVLGRYVVHHPVMTRAGDAARARTRSIQGRRRTWFCGAYAGNGFHEDGVNAALAVCADFGRRL